MSTTTAEPAIPTTERHCVNGAELLQRVKALIHEGNVRRIVIKSDDGHTQIEFPLTVGVVSAALVPVMVAIGAIAALAANYTIEVERRPGVV